MTSYTLKIKILWAVGALLLAILAAASLFTGKYPLSFEKLLAGDELQLRVFWTLRVSRTLAGVIGGFALGTAGFAAPEQYSTATPRAATSF